MGNLDFSNQAGFSWYCVLLFISGVAMLCMVGVPAVSKGARIANLLFGAGFTFYAIYLVFMFKGGHYFVFFKAFILPVFLIVAAIKSAADKRNAKTAQPYQPPAMNYGAPQQPDQQQPQSPYGTPSPYAPQQPYGYGQQGQPAPQQYPQPQSPQQPQPQTWRQ